MALYDEFKQLMRNRRYRDAAFLAEKAAASTGGRETAFWLNQQSLALIRMNHPGEAVKIAEQALVCCPGGFYSMLIRAEALYFDGDVAAALEGFREVLRFQPAEARARRGILDCLIKSRNFEEALSVVAESSNNPGVYYLYKARALDGLGRLSEAIDVCNEWLMVSVDDRTALRQLSDLEVRRDGVAPVLAKYEKLAKIPSRPPVYGEICASLHKRAGNTDRELGHYDKLAAKTGDLFIIRKKAFALAKSGRETEAISLFEELLRSEPADQYVNSAYCAASRRAGYLEGAWKFYHELLALFPEEKAIYGRIKRISGEMERFGGSE